MIGKLVNLKHNSTMAMTVVSVRDKTCSQSGVKSVSHCTCAWFNGNFDYVTAEIPIDALFFL